MKVNKLFTKKHIIHLIVFNDRLQDYEYYIEYAKNNSYNIKTMSEFYASDRNGKNFILRHDVDHNGVNVRKMFETERKIGVKSTYYFRFSTIDLALIKEMKDAGFEVGLHFETISDYIRENHIENKNEIDTAEMRERLKSEISRFENIIGFKINSVCSHGASENARLGISNNVITDNCNLSDIGVMFEAYDKQMYENDVHCHIMDNSILYNYGFSYKDNPISAVDEGYQNIVFLAHPSHWYFSFKNRVRWFVLLLLGKGAFETSRTFERMKK